jgi:hypothetical protein
LFYPIDNAYSFAFSSKICSSDLISDEWIASLYNAETTTITPLDFRLIAVPVFRLIAVQCEFFKANIDSIRDVISSERLVSSRVLSEATFDGQVKTIHEKFNAYMVATVVSSYYGKLIMLIIRLGGFASAINTNIFQMSVPGSDEYQYFNNFYPIHDNATSVNVSDA